MTTETKPDLCPRCGNEMTQHFQQNNRDQGGTFVKCEVCGYSEGAV